MTLTLNLPRELEQRLLQEAQRRGVAVEQCALQLLEHQLAPRDRCAEAVALIQSWIDADDVEEQKETGDFLIQALDEDRPSERKLFPAELKGVTW
ncbi:MAG TPA: hypothetical protein VNK04_04190 [Gemmataceae bacterium]|jgi:hypothetical protein|nr:hypothetical protein [Gemmataceae bacterium]